MESRGQGSQQVRIRQATANDADVLGALSAFLQQMHEAEHPAIFKPFAQDAAAAFFRSQLAHPAVVIVIAEVNTEPAGFLMAEVLNQDETPFTAARRVLHVQHLAVVKGAQRRGVGKVLVDFADQEAGRRSCDALQLSVWSFNRPALAFFESQGLEPFQIRMTRATSSGTIMPDHPTL